MKRKSKNLQLAGLEKKCCERGRIKGSHKEIINKKVARWVNTLYIYVGDI